MIDEKFAEIIKSNTGCAVVMAGSDSDEPHIDKVVKSLEKYGIPYQVRICSAHKQADYLIEIINEYNQINGLLAYVGIAGGNDALSGTLSFHALAPVISSPPDTRYADKEKYIKEFNESCLTNPPGSSNAYVARPGNVGKIVAQMFAGVNPNIRKILQEEKDSKVAKLQQKDNEFKVKYGGK